MSGLVAGVDVSTRLIAVVVLDAETGKYHTRLKCFIPELEKLDHNTANRARHWTIRYAAEFLAGPDIDGDVNTVYVEQPFGPHVKSIAEVERVIGAFLGALPDSITASLIQPGTWKRLAGLPGNASKGAVRAHAETLYPTLRNSVQDVCDAALIARAAWTETPTGTTKGPA